MASIVRNRSSGRQRLRQGYVGKTFQLEGRQYVVEDVIAEGGFAVVLEVRCLSGNNETLALKRVAVNNEQDLYLCRQEIAIIRALSDCPNSITYVSSQINRIGKDVFEVLILTQLYGGQSVLKIIQQHFSQSKSIPEAQVMKIFCDVCLAVSRLHHRTKPIVHRDLKIENVLQDYSGNFILCDYGSATTQVMIPSEMGVTVCEDQIKKFTTLAYRAPEMTDLYSGHMITTKSDIWALGCFLYKLCFFDTPFGEQTLAIMRGTFTIPTTSSYSSNLHKLIKFMLVPDPKERPDIFQVAHLSYQMLGRANPVANIFNSTVPVLPGTPPVDPKTKDESVTKRSKVHLSPVESTPKSQGASPIITTSTKARPRPRPTSSVGPPPSPMTPRTQNSSSSPNDNVQPSQAPNRTLSNGSTSHLTESIDSSNTSLRIDHSVSQPLPPLQPSTDPFGHTPLWDHDAFGSTPFNTTVTQTT